MGWVGCVTIPGVVLLVIYLALFFGAWGWLAHRFLRSCPNSLRLLVILPAAWAALEYARAHLLTGLGWNLLAHTQWGWLDIIQIADLGGVWLVSFLVLLVNTALWLALRAPRQMARKATLIAGLCLLGSLAYGGLRDHQVWHTLVSPSMPGASPLKVALIQGNIPQEEKWDESFGEFIWKRYEHLIRQAAGRHPDLIVLPETAVPGFLEEPGVQHRLSALVQAGGVPLLAGTPTESEDFNSDQIYNSAALFGADGQEQARYNKIHLVPFGEFIPIQPIFGWLEKFYPVANFAPGRRFTLFRAAPAAQPQAFARFSVLICFEDLFPDLVRRFKREGAEWFLVITNDAWFKRSAASVQHLQASVFRAVENRVWIGRAANTGWTGFVDPCGRRLPAEAQVPRFKQGIAVGEVWRSQEQPLYSRWGDWFPICCIIAVGLAFLPSRRPL